ncbi:hypothetical protein L1887_52998 [Cichorium endivia]|nr:hypothetical protein L1887_52998 [Cichorium endivia]
MGGGRDIEGPPVYVELPLAALLLLARLVALDATVHDFALALLHVVHAPHREARNEHRGGKRELGRTRHGVRRFGELSTGRGGEAAERSSNGPREAVAAQRVCTRLGWLSFAAAEEAIEQPKQRLGELKPFLDESGRRRETLKRGKTRGDATRRDAIPRGDQATRRR